MEKELNENQIKILEVNTRLSRHKIIENFNKFKHFIDKKGSLDLKNFTEFYQNMLPNKGNAEQFCKFIFYAIDKDRSGTVDFNEFILAIGAFTQGETRDRLQWMFKVYDLDNDDLNKNGTSLDYQINDIFNQLDKETDNLITINEFVDGCMKDDFLLYFLNPTI